MNIKYSVNDFSQIDVAGGPVFDLKNNLFFGSNISGNFQIYYSEIKINQSLWPKRLTFNTENRTTTPRLSKDGSLFYLTDNGGNEKWQIYMINDPTSKFSEPLTYQLDRIHRLNYVGKEIYFSANLNDISRFDLYTIDYIKKSKPTMLVKNTTRGILSISDVNQDESLILCAEMTSNTETKLHLFDKIKTHLKLIPITDHINSNFTSAKFIDDDTLICLSNRDREFMSVCILKIKDNTIKYLENDLWDTEYLVYHKASNQIAFSKNEEGYSTLFHGKISDGELIDLNQISIPEKSVINAGDFRSYNNAMNFNSDGTLLAFNVESSAKNTNIWVINLNEQISWKATNAETGIIPESYFINEKLLKVKSFDNLEFSSYIYYPNIDNKNQFPCVIIIHGGPEAQARPGLNPIIQYLLQEGFVVAVPNVRGSKGYGKTFLTLDDIELRLNSVKDIIALSDILKKDDKIDRNRIAVYGGSYGGFMVLSCVTEYPNTFYAGIDVVGIANFITFLENTAPWRRKYREVEYGYLDKHRDFLRSISPINKVNQIKCPMLIIHGKNDERVPVGEAEQIYSQLKERNVSVDLLLFDDEGHGIVKRKNKNIYYNRVVTFLKSLQ